VKKILSAIGNGLFTLWWLVMAPIMHILGIPFAIFFLALGKRDFVTKLSRGWSRLLFIFGFTPLHIIGEENIDRNSKMLYVANHSCFFDPHALLAFVPNMTFTGKKEVLSIPLIGWGLKASGGIPIDRKNFMGSMENLYRVAREAKPGFCMAIFPEGTRTLTGEPGEFKRGFVRISQRGELDIIPVTMNGFWSFKPKNRKTFHRPSRLEIIIHKPIPYKELEQMKDDDIIARVRGDILSAYRKPE